MDVCHEIETADERRFICRRESLASLRDRTEDIIQSDIGGLFSYLYPQPGMEVGLWILLRKKN